MLKQFLRFLEHMKDKKMYYTPSNSRLASQIDIVVYADSSFEENVSRMGLLAFVCSNLVSWASQSRVATSTTEGQILAVQNVVSETEYIGMLVKELGFNELLKDSTTILNHNLSEIAFVRLRGKA